MGGCSVVEPGPQAPPGLLEEGVGSPDGQLELASRVLCNQDREFEPDHVGLGASVLSRQTISICA